MESKIVRMGLAFHFLMKATNPSLIPLPSWHDVKAVKGSFKSLPVFMVYSCSLQYLFDGTSDIAKNGVESVVIVEIVMH